VLAFHTDSDLPGVHRTDLMAEAAMPPGLALLLADAGFASDGNSAVTPANSAVLEPAVGASWLAAGDAALSFDPLSSQGLLNAIFTGRAAARAAANHLAGASDALSDYAAILAEIHADYRRQLSFWYGAEARWPDSLFWRRRQLGEAGSTGSMATPSARRR
jgi:flavin-dependent dehydrogenase